MINAGKLFLVSSSKESTWVGARVFLVSVPVGQPNTQDLCEAEEETNATNESQNLSSIRFDDGGTR